MERLRLELAVWGLRCLAGAATAATAEMAPGEGGVLDRVRRREGAALRERVRRELALLEVAADRHLDRTALREAARDRLEDRRLDQIGHRELGRLRRDRDEECK